MAHSGIGLLLVVLEKAAYISLICIFALGGVLVGAITGAVTGQTTETGFVRGAGIGAVAGALVAIELLESLINGELLSKIGLFGSLLNGKIFREWVSPAMLKAYQWQIAGLETSYREISDIYDVEGTRGMSPDHIMKELPNFRFTSSKTRGQCGEDICCSICLQDFNEGDHARRLPNCRHLFHMACIDEWLVRQGSCPLCREDV